ncbi:MAG: hypothetical protein UT55_C0022G0007 [Candidatus Peregrinibacteria bacterium GW2011_GWE2_39_6]|nr:MAG: hypothetical protein UT36_C0006G0024 [Candidatus Peregrinibacteria bacterium GW2011_GWF2_39_17]KKR25989.1 MAG: hypothetical protein UT55_C0022G0007 [Candidatus Peregrinibacteria bacterium GW2011_GWE2_39_6]HCW32813.1 hypothetical protein [Candidatus Peregrinibacteria bacterium]
MNPSRTNSSLVAVFFILLVITGVIYLFWQNNLAQEETLKANIPGQNPLEIQVESQQDSPSKQEEPSADLVE